VFGVMSPEYDVVLQREHVVERMPRKPLDSLSIRASVANQWNRPRVQPSVDQAKWLGAWSDAQQVELLATRRRIVSTTSRPRDELMA
jgi:hypothetical protein